MLKDVGRLGPGSHVDVRSRARAATGVEGVGAEQDGRGERGEGDGVGDKAISWGLEKIVV